MSPKLTYWDTLNLTLTITLTGKKICFQNRLDRRSNILQRQRDLKNQNVWTWIFKNWHVWNWILKNWHVWTWIFKNWHVWTWILKNWHVWTCIQGLFYNKTKMLKEIVKAMTKTKDSLLRTNEWTSLRSAIKVREFKIEWKYIIWIWIFRIWWKINKEIEIEINGVRGGALV